MKKISDYLYRKASINKIPLSGCFELSPVCNFSCKMCYVRKTQEQIKKEGKKSRIWTEWISLAEECRKEGMLYLLLTGGEPFLYPHFKELYLVLHKMGFLISINSNGSMIDESTVEWLKDAAPTRINITLYGSNAHTYEEICGNKYGYERAKKAVLLLKEAGISVVVNASMIPQNAEDMTEIIHFGKSNNIFTRVSTYMFPPARREKEESDSRFTPGQAAEMYLKKQKCLLEEDEYQRMLRTELSKLGKCSETDEEIWGNDLEYMRCRAGRSSFWVSWEGVMTACGMLSFPAEVFPFERPFRECWLELTNKVRTTKVLKECNRCEKKEICNPCVAMLYTETGEVNKKSPYLCEMTDCIINSMKKEVDGANI